MTTEEAGTEEAGAVNGKTKAILTGATWGFLVALVAEVVRFSLGLRDFSEIGWTAFTFLSFVIFGAAITAWAYSTGAGIYASRSRKTPVGASRAVEVEEQESEKTRTYT